MTACTTDSGVSIPDFIKVAKAFNLPTLTIDNPSEIREKVNAVLNMQGPVLCEVMLSHGYIFAPKLSARKLDDGTMVSPSLEDLYPFLPREELEANYIAD